MEDQATPPEKLPSVRPVRLRWFRIAATIVAAIVLLVAVGSVAVPPLAKHLLEGKLGEALHRPVTVREVRFNPLELCLTVSGFTILEREGHDEFVSFDELFVDLEAVSVIYWAPVVRELRLRGPRVHLARREDGSTYNFSDLLGGARDPDGGAMAAKPEKPARFALHNIRVSGGRIVFEDLPRGAHHEVADLELTIPFVSNFPAAVDTFEQPALSALFNGAPFRLAGQTKPFKETLETAVDIDLPQIDIPRYLAYLPADLGFTVREGLLGTKLSVSFSSLPKGPALLVRGSVRLDQVVIVEPAGAPLIACASVEVPAFTLDVFKRRLDIEKLAIVACDATLVLREMGGLNWSAAFRTPVAQSPPGAESNPWQVTLQEVRLADGKLHWRDEAVPGGFSAEIEGVEAGISAMAFPQHEPAAIDLAFRTGFGETLRHRGSIVVSPLVWEGDIDITGVRPRAWEAYYRRSLAYAIREGVLGAAAHVRLASGAAGTAFGFTGLTARLDGLRVRHRGAPADFLTLDSLELSGGGFDLQARQLNLGSLMLRKGILGLVRDVGGVVPGVPQRAPAKLAEASPPSAAVHPAVAPPAATPTVPEEPSWLVEAAAVRLDDCGANLVDTTVPEWLTHTVAPLSAEATGLSTKKGSRAAFRLAAGINGEGRISLQGDLGLVPFGARVDLDLGNLSLVPWYPYYADRVNFVTSSGALAVKGSLAVVPGRDGAVGVSFRGEAGVSDFVSVDRLNAEEMLNWKSLALGGIALEASPFSLKVDEVVLSEFYSRLIIFPDGQLNVQKAVVGEEVTAPPEVTVPPSGTAAPAAAVTIARTTIQGGTVSFSDRFVRPNYSALLTDLAGRVSGLSSLPGTTADLDLRGHLNRSAPLSISGEINPLAGNLFLDIKAVVRDIELVALSSYTGKYLGYDIEKGKMGFDVAYRIENRRLSAENRLMLDQFTFGKRVESPEATSLPVQLAVALLKDRHGVIDVNLPISGSLDDPEFSVGRLVLRIVINIVAKAVTSPFALVGALVGGGAELSFAQFETGGDVPVPEGRKGIEALRAALVERPGLRLEITGHADPVSDRTSLRRRRFERQLKAQKLKDKELPLEETENLLLTNTAVTDDDLVDLANRRAQAARDLLTAESDVAPERVFLLAPVVAAADDEGKRPAARVEFNLK